MKTVQLDEHSNVQWMWSASVFDALLKVISDDKSSKPGQDKEYTSTEDMECLVWIQDRTNQHTVRIIDVVHTILHPLVSYHTFSYRADQWFRGDVTNLKQPNPTEKKLF